VKRLHQLGKDSLVYGLGAILAKGIGFFLLPIYTRIFTPADYGTIEMLTVIASFFSAFLAMGMDSAQSFYFFQQKESGKAAQARLVSAILQWRLTWGLALVGAATLAAPLLNAFFFGGRLGWEYFAVAFAGALFAQLMSQGIEVFRLLYRPWPYVLITMTQTLMAAALILLLVLYYEQGIFGYFLGTLLASAFAAGLGWYLVRDYLDFSRLQTAWWRPLLRFGVPLLPAGLAMYVMSTSDRWFIQHYHGETMLGIYAVGAKFALIMALAIEIFRKAWWPVAMDAMHSEDGPETYRAIAQLFMGAGVAAVVYLAFLSPWLVKWLTTPAYQDAWHIVSVLAWQSLLYGFYLVASAGIWKTEKTRYSMYLMGGAAVLNLGLNWLLVPSFGAMGAAVSTVTSYLVWIWASMWLSERLWKVGFPMFLIAIQIGLGLGVVAWLLKFDHAEWFTVLVVHVVVLVLLASALDKNIWAALRKRLAGNV
jgi:O-antigen/teichoic acid export membrane protein